MEKKVKIFSTKQKDIDEIVEAGFKEFGMEERFIKAKKVFIKPNLVSDTDEHIKAHCNTETVLIRAVLKYLKKFNLKVFLGESELNAGLIGRRLFVALDKMGVLNLKKEFDFEIVNLTKEPKENKLVIKFKNSLALKKLELNKILFEVDYIINLPKIKTHKFTVMTGALKNYFGLIPDPFRVKYHKRLHRVIADINSLFINKTFNVVDGIIAMEGNGPKWGNPIPLDIILFGDDSAAVDIVMANIMKIRIDEVKHLKMFINHYHKIKESDINIISDLPFDKISFPFKRSKLNLYMKIERHILPWICKPLMCDFSVRYFLYPLRHFIKKIRGGHCSFYLDN